MSKKGNLYLIPNIIADDTQHLVISEAVKEQLKKISHFLAEDIRTARRYLSSLKIFDQIESLDFKVLNKDTPADEIEKLFSPLIHGNPIGVISESGCPGVADPGAMAVAYAHSIDVKVIPLVGPSSILLALMASGLNGQQFAFHGYLPIDKGESSAALKRLEKESKQKNQTQIFIETPYRNNQLFSTLISTLSKETLLCVAIDLTGKEESIQTKRIANWRRTVAEWPKQPAVFLFLAH